MDEEKKLTNKEIIIELIKEAIIIIIYGVVIAIGVAIWLDLD